MASDPPESLGECVSKSALALGSPTVGGGLVSCSRPILHPISVKRGVRHYLGQSRHFANGETEDPALGLFQPFIKVLTEPPPSAPNGILQEGAQRGLEVE